MNLKSFTLAIASITTVAFASSATTQASSAMNMMEFVKFLPFIPLFYYFLIHQPKKRAKEQQELLKTLKKGDKVMTTTGIMATISKIDENKNTAMVEIASNVEIEILKTALTVAPINSSSVVSLVASKKQKTKTVN